MSSPVFAEGIVRRERFRRSTMDGDKRQAIVDRVLKFAKDDVDSRADDRERRLQRYAKYRMWTEGKDYPWENSSDIALSDIPEAVLNLQDTLANAILASRPVVNANSLLKENSEKESSVDRVLDSQFFVEQEGEKICEELAELFLIDGVFTAYVPWIRERRPVTDLRIYDAVPEDGSVSPASYFRRLVEQVFPDQALFLTNDKDGWDYRVELDDKTMPPVTVSFYTREKDGKVEMLIRKMTEVYNGPRVLVKDYEDVLTPPRVANLQPPGPTNPGGASHVILVDTPTIDEIENLKREGFYDLARTDENRDDLGLRSRDDSEDELKKQKDVIQGVQEEPRPTDPEHRTVTRYMCFDVYDLDGDGVPEDVIWWVLKEDRMLLKAMPLTEMFPSDPPRRPLAEAAFLPIKGRREGWSLIELMEGLHDFLKEMLDQGVDGGTLSTTPFFFYRAGSSMKPEIMRPWPGDGIPLSDPNDVHFPSIPFDGSFSLNAFAIGRQLQERLTLEGDLQSGRVPQGKSSALRTVGGINTILAQGEARPERILRRFFMGFAEIFTQMHELNQYFFPDEKQIRVLGIGEPSEDPYPKIVRQEDLDGRFKFDFRASILNSSKAAKLQGLERMMAMLINPLMIQLGIVGPDEIFKMVRDSAQSSGVDPDRYLKEPSPGAGKIRLTANEAISIVMSHMIPDGVPAEPSAQDHLDQLQSFMQDDRFGLLDQSQLDIFKAWLMQVMQLAIAQEGQEEIAQLTEGFQQKLSAGAEGGNGAAAPVDAGQAPVNKNELVDETLPGNGRGVG